MIGIIKNMTTGIPLLGPHNCGELYIDLPLLLPIHGFMDPNVKGNSRNS